jgi:hypothetical protein
LQPNQSQSLAHLPVTTPPKCANVPSQKVKTHKRIKINYSNPRPATTSPSDKKSDITKPTAKMAVSPNPYQLAKPGDLGAHDPNKIRRPDRQPLADERTSSLRSKPVGNTI